MYVSDFNVKILKTPMKFCKKILNLFLNSLKKLMSHLPVLLFIAKILFLYTYSFFSHVNELIKTICNINMLMKIDSIIYR